jgi:hypothetical protein
MIICLKLIFYDYLQNSHIVIFCTVIEEVVEKGKRSEGCGK